MRALHLSFLLHYPYELQDGTKWKKGYFGGEADFKRADKSYYQLLFALLERNTQRYARMRVSLVISGIWLEQAERWDPELIKRLQKLVKSGGVEVVAEPYDNSLAAFYDWDELTRQIELCQERCEDLFDEKAKVVALPRLCFQNKIARWAEKQGFRVVLAGDARSFLDWRTENRVYEAKGCEDLRVLFMNLPLSRMINEAEAEVVMEVEEEVKVERLERPEKAQRKQTATDFVRALAGESTEEEVKEEMAPGVVIKKRKILSAQMFQKQLDLAFLRGNVVNLWCEVESLGKLRDLGIIGFYDELFKLWSTNPGNIMLSAADVLKLKPAAELSCKKTVSLGGEAEKEYAYPVEWSDAKTVKVEKRLYGLRDEILKSEDKELYADFAKLTDIELTKDVHFEEVLGDLERRVREIMAQPEAEREKAKQGIVESTTVKVNFQRKSKGASKEKVEVPKEVEGIKVDDEVGAEEVYEQLRDAAGIPKEETGEFWNAEDMDDMEAAIQVLAQRMKKTGEGTESKYDDLAEAELVETIDDADFFAEAESELEAERKSDAAKVKRKQKKIVID